MEYVDFDLWIGPAVDGRYLVRARSKGLGGARGHLDAQSFLAGVRDVLPALVSQRAKSQLLVAFGSWLYGELFRGEVGERFRFCFEHTRRLGRGTRLRLDIEPPELGAVPWELLYSSAEDTFLAALVECPLVRCPNLARDVKPLEVQSPLGVLVCIPSVPEPFADIDVDAERARIIEAIDSIGGVRHRVLEGQVTRQRLVDALVEDSYHCIHFIGHGGYENGIGFLIFNTETGGADRVEHDFLAAQLRNHPSMRLAFLNCCESARTSIDDAMAGLAPRLVQSRVPAVLAMQRPIDDRAAIRFARNFYRSLFRGDNSGCVDYAVSHARCQLLGDSAGEQDFATPALYLLGEGILFTGDALEQSPQTRDRAANIERRLRHRNYLIVSSSAVLGACFFAFWVSLFDALQIDTVLERWVMRMGDPFTSTALDARIAFLIIDDATQDAVGDRFGPQWRERHASLVERLAAAGAAVVAFDMHFGEETEHDDVFASAIDAADARGTRIVLGFRDRADDGRPVVSDRLARSAAALGAICQGSKLGLARSMPLLIQPGAAASSESAPPREPLPSLSLAIYMAMHDQSLPGRIHPDDWRARKLVLQPSARSGASSHGVRVAFSEVQTSSRYQKGCPTIRDGDRMAELVLSPSPLRSVTERRLRYESVLLDGPLAFGQLEGKLLLIGVDRPAEEFEDFGAGDGGRRLGVELHGDALNAQIRGEAVKSLGEVAQLLIMLVLGALAAAVRFQAARAGLGLIVLGAVMLAYLAFAVLVYVEYLLLLNVAYHVAALLLSYWAAGRVERRWFA